MFVNEDSFKKLQVTFNVGDDFFRVDGRLLSFADIVACYVSETAHFAHSTFQGYSLRLVLTFTSGAPREIW